MSDLAQFTTRDLVPMVASEAASLGKKLMDYLDDDTGVTEEEFLKIVTDPNSWKRVSKVRAGNSNVDLDTFPSDAWVREFETEQYGDQVPATVVTDPADGKVLLVSICEV